MRKRSVVIVGGGIGGLTVARLLAADGHGVTVIERAKDFSAQGHSIGFRGVGLQVMDELGLRARVEAQGRNYSATRTYTMRGAPLRTIARQTHAQAVGGAAVTQRGLLHAALHEDLPSQIALLFGVRPIALREEGEVVVVDLSDGQSLRADIVVGADGANSTVRRLVMADVEALDRGGVYVAMTIHTHHGLPANELTTFYGVARIASFFPVDEGSVAVVIYQDDGYGPIPDEDSPQAWAVYLNASFAGAAEPVRRILGALKSGDDVYHDRIRLVPPVRAVSGRVALVGDAGYCPTFFSGNGSALAALGAYCLARCLRKSDDDRAALAGYEASILPLATGYQANADRLRIQLFARSPVAIFIRQLAMRHMPNWVMARSMKRHYRGEVRLEDCT